MAVAAAGACTLTVEFDEPCRSDTYARSQKHPSLITDHAWNLKPTTRSRQDTAEHLRGRDGAEEVTSRLQDALPAHPRLQEERDRREHAEAAVLNLSEGELRVNAIIREAKGIEADVARHTALRLGRRGLHDPAANDDLEEAEARRRRERSVGAGALEQTSAVRPAARALLPEHAKRRKHRNAAVLQLGRAVLDKLRLIRREVERIPHLAIEAKLRRRAVELVDGDHLRGRPRGRRRARRHGRVEGEGRDGELEEHRVRRVDPTPGHR
eukprot:CAMPEP_0119413052 /NCGR_PEP_ID=MMETSP1335-20130426/5267_1 /TAXON_ID=259385 /ORGANISM="Chrysoculter rhomboideus, Strain RCC1486" /LENGTH=267 /DNA_ID=CAMNT_0007437825 /DNA_START=107 /DNA_END=908 /DNA_ORIENTATION=-